MNTFFQQLTDHPLTEVVGWTLVHFLWQGLLIAVVAAILLVCLRRASSATRYLFACGGLALMALAPLVTAAWLTVAMLEAREPQQANSNLNLDSFVTQRSQAEIPKTLSAPVTNDLVTSKPVVVSPQNAGAKTPNAAEVSWRETLRNCFPYFVVLWTVGVLLLSLRLLGGLWRVQQWRRRGVPIKTAELKEMTVRLVAVMGLNRKFELLESAQAVVPAVIGWLKPAVIVPTSLITGLSPAELESLLAHELAHIRRHDYLVNVLQTVIETVLFYHPAVWWLSRVVRCERENCCDDLAVAACGSSMVFAKALTKMEELRCGDPRLALSARGGSLLARVQRLLAPSAANRADVWWPAGALVLGAIALALSGLFLAVATAESDHQQNANKATAHENKIPQTKPWTANPAKQDPQKNIPQVPMPNRPTPPSLKPDRSFKVEFSPGDEGPARPDQVGVKVLASRTYNSASRQSTHFIPLNDTSVPVDQGIEYQGVAIYLTLMFDLVAVDARSGEVLWHRDWSKSHPFWKTVSVVELGNGANSKLAVELFAPAPKANEMAYLYLDLKTGTELQPPAAAPLSSIPLKVVEQDNGVIKRIELKAIAEGRSPKDLWKLWTSTRHVTGGPGVSITDFETLVSASQNARWLGTTVDADEIVFSLPEGSGIRAEFFGDKVEIIENGNQTSVVVTNGKVNLIDQGGVVRAWASADSGAEQTIVEVSFQQQEFVLRLKAKRLVDDPKFMPNMQCATFPETGAAKDEEQSPHGAVRYEVKEDKEKHEFLLRISWRYDVDRIRAEAESTDQDTPSSIFQSSTTLQNESAPLTVPAGGDSDLVAKARKLGDWLEFKPGFRFDSIGYLRLAGELMALDEPRRAAALRSMANAKLEGQTITLCRMLFEKKPDLLELRRPSLGGPHFVGTTTEMKDWPLEPITLVGEVPLLIVNGYTLAGPREPAIDYLEFCLANCVWSKRTFSEIEQAIATADQAIRQPAFWGGEIDESEWREWADLRSQLRPSLAIEVKQQPWVNIVVPLYSALDVGTSKVSEVVEKVVASSLSTDAPVTLIISNSAKPEWIEPLVRQLAEAGYRNQEHIWWQKEHIWLQKSHEPIKQPEFEKILSDVQLNIQAKADADWGAVEPTTGLRLRLTLAEASVPAGKPVLGKLELQNAGKQAAKYDPQTFAPFRVVQIADEKGKPAQFIGPRPQTSSSPLELAPGEPVTLWENVDLSDLYLLDSGNYEVTVVINDRHQNLILESGSARLKVDGGQLAPKMQLLKQLRSIAPADWGVSTSFGAIYLSHSPTNLKQDVTTIQLWFTDEPLPADYKLGEGEDQQQVTTIAPTELGFLHMAAPKKANELWPEHVLLIKTAAARVLNFNAKQGIQGEKETDKENDVKDQVNELPWRAKGRVTDREGKPLAGVNVRAHCGIGSLMPTGEAVTNAEGNYELQFGPGMFLENRQLVQAATISVSLDGHFEQNLHRQGDLIAVLEKPEDEDLGWGGKKIKDLFLPGEPKMIDFVMLPATKLKGVVIGKDGDRLDGVRVSLTGQNMPPSCSVVAQTQTDKGGRFELTNLPTGFAFQLLIEPAKKQSPALSWASSPLKLDPFVDGYNCFSIEYKGRNRLYRVQELLIQLDGDGINWKEALASATGQKVVIQIDGFDNDNEKTIRVSAGQAKLRLGSDRVQNKR